MGSRKADPGLTKPQRGGERASSAACVTHPLGRPEVGLVADRGKLRARSSLRLRLHEARSVKAWNDHRIGGSRHKQQR